ncbi:efflux RND transporter periplasmic adaptor subunit [Thalassolituus pacificus]|uniref:Efflux RND transporter periplasmic adaptor subunit n=1 Tax=Thalassolituus pacificus TaxID=2975440 RepID=A0A9X2WE40_9GAMM|nr:HlyD family efflux transporter periplasmic adaptor subunit [Thalassolituus pacificus]MCT7358466.1 efflux RND transporter periplasmic adaptor subunit [Thalassolituus pacificus]
MKTSNKHLAKPFSKNLLKSPPALAFILALLLVFFVADIYKANAATDSDDHQHQEDEHTEESGSHGHGNDEKHEDEEGTSQIEDAMAQTVGIVTERSGEQTLHQTILTYGRLTTAPEQTSHVRARFSGVVTSVRGTIGETVAAGDLLAEVEANESLRKYSIRAPIAGMIVQRHANSGEVTGDQILFSISSFDNLWAELRIFPSQRSSVAIGQEVFLSIGEQKVKTKIEHLLPAGDEQPYLIARAKLSNDLSMLSPGSMAEGRIVIDEFNVDVAVKIDALQILGGRTGVFVKHGNKYEFIPLIVGRKDDSYAEVISGLKPDTEYVTQNSYLIKADIEKSEAEHEH